jgi:hypothetical protein
MGAKMPLMPTSTRARIAMRASTAFLYAFLSMIEPPFFEILNYLKTIL